MATERARLIELTLVRYREDEDPNYIYFWVEKYNNERIGDVFESEEDALYWFKELQEKTKDVMQEWKIRKL